MAIIRNININDENAKLFSTIATPSIKNSDARIRFSRPGISARKIAANRANSPGGTVAEVIAKIQDEEIDGWQEFAEQEGIRWTTAASAVAGSLCRLEYPRIGRAELGLLTLGGATSITQAPAPDGQFNTIFFCDNNYSGSTYLFHRQPQSYIIRQKIPQLKNVYDNYIQHNYPFRTLIASVDFNLYHGEITLDYVVRAYESENATGAFDYIATTITETGKYTLELPETGKTYNSYVIFLYAESGYYLFTIDNLSVKSGAIELFPGGDFEDYAQRQLPYFSQNLPVFDYAELKLGPLYGLDFLNLYL